MESRLLKIDEETAACRNAPGDIDKRPESRHIVVLSRARIDH